MTATTFHSSAVKKVSSKKILAKKTISLATSSYLKCTAPNNALTLLQHAHIKVSSDDTGLQSADCRRRYMRRGSKTPAMLMLSAAYFDLSTQPLHLEEQQEVNRDEHISGNDAVHEANYPITTVSAPLTPKQPAYRRLSIMTALKQTLEQASLIEHSPSPETRSMPFERTHSFTFDLLSKL
jgi:hypothetical protein